MLSVKLESSRKRKINVDLTQDDNIARKYVVGFKPGDIVYVGSASRFMRVVMPRVDLIILTDDDGNVLVSGYDNVAAVDTALALTTALVDALDSLSPSITEGVRPSLQWIRDHWFRDLRHGGNLYIDLPAVECDVITTYERNFTNPKITMTSNRPSSEMVAANRKILAEVINQINEEMEINHE